MPYLLLFYPDDQELTLYHHTGRKYVSIKPDENNRCGIPELHLEVGLLDGWVRFWFKGVLLPLPADLQADLDEARRQLKLERRRADQERQRADQEHQRAGQEREARLAAERALQQLRAQMNK